MSPASDRSPALQLTAEQLAVRAAAGSLPSFVELLSRFEGRVFNFLVRRVRVAADAEDLTQETFLRAWQSIGRYRPKFRFSTWLFTIATRLAVDHHRLKHRHWTGVSPDVPDARAHRDASSANEPENGGLWDLAATLLTSEQHSALWLRYAEDLTPKEIARVLGRTQIAVRVMLFRARETLAARVSQQNSELQPHSQPPARSRSIEGGVPCTSR